MRRGLFTRVVLVLHVGTALPVGAARGKILAVTDVFVGGQEGPQGTSNYRIPGMTVAPDGAILAFAEGRRSGADPGQGGFPIDLVQKRSTDGGQNWEPLVVLQSNSAFDYDDPTPVVDAVTGSVHLIHASTPDDCGLFCVPPGTGTDSMNIFQLSSQDSGQTWTDAVNITVQVKDPVVRGIVPGPGSGIQLRWQSDPARNGRLVIPAHINATDNFVFYSDDHGMTWQSGGLAVGPNGNENEVVELTNGDLLINARQSGGSLRRTYISSDGGDSWGAHLAGDIAMTTVDASLIRYSAARDGHDRDRLLFSAPLGPGRTNMAVWTSYDEGQSYINPVQLDEGHGAYSVLKRLSDGNIGLLFEATGSTLIQFTSFDVAELEKADHPASMTNYDGFGNEVDPFRGGVGWNSAWTNADVTTREGLLEFPGYFTEDDTRHAHLRGASMTRNLGSGALDLDQDQDFYVSLFINHDSDDGEDSSGGEFLDILLKDLQGVTHAAFGVGSAENFFINEIGEVVSSESGAAERDTTYLLLAKLAATEAASGTGDQLFLSWYDDPEDLPVDDSEVIWDLVSGTSENLSTTLEQITFSAGVNADWRVDGIRFGTTFDAVIVDTGIVPDPPLGDLDGDGRFTTADWRIFRAAVSTDTSGLPDDERPGVGDFDADGFIGPRDFTKFVSLFDTANGLGAFTAAHVPEPSTGVLLGIVLVLGGVRFRTRWCMLPAYEAVNDR